MKRIFLHIAIIIFTSSVLLALCNENGLMKQPLPAPDEPLPFIEQPGKGSWNNGMKERQSVRRVKIAVRKVINDKS